MCFPTQFLQKWLKNRQITEGYLFLLPSNSKHNFLTISNTHFLPMNPFDILKSLTRIASEFNCSAKTLSKHIKESENLKTKINTRVLQMPRKQKLIYEEFGYPPSVNKSDYDDI